MAGLSISRESTAIVISVATAVIAVIALKLGALVDWVGPCVAVAWIWTSEWLRGRLWLLKVPFRRVILEAHKSDGALRQPATVITKSLTIGGVAIFITSFIISSQ